MSSRLPLLLVLAAFGCDSSPVAPDGGPDAGPPLEPSVLFGPCEEDWQCPGEGAVCRTAADGWPGGFCTLPCEDRTPCDANGVYHHCATREGETQSFCERRCLNGIDCGRTAYSCEGELPPSGGVCVGVCSEDAHCGAGTLCDVFAARCTAEPLSDTGSAIGEGCADDDACRSEQCIEELSPDLVPSGWVGGYCVSNCILPSGYNNNDFYAGDDLPSGSCQGDAVCLPAGGGQAFGDLGRCFDRCVEDGDCRGGYGCLREFGLASGGVSTYPSGVCAPVDCNTEGCPDGYDCVTVTASGGGTRAVCGPL